MSKDFVSQYFCVSEEWIEDGQKKAEVAINLDKRIVECVGDNFKDYSSESARETPYDPGRIHVFHQDEDGIIELQFLRLRETTPGSILDKNDQLQPMELPEGSCMVESCTALYDPLTRVLVAQPNHHGASAVFLTYYLNCLLHDDARKNYFRLTPMIAGRLRLEYLMGKIIKGLKVKVACEGEALAVDKKMSQFNRFEASTVEFAARAGRSKKAQLNKEAVMEQIEALYGDAGTQKLEVTYLNEEARNSTVNLLQDRMQDMYVIKRATKKNPATHREIYFSIKEKYLERVRGSKDERLKARKEKLDEH